MTGPAIKQVSHVISEASTTLGRAENADKSLMGISDVISESMDFIVGLSTFLSDENHLANINKSLDSIIDEEPKIELRNLNELLSELSVIVDQEVKELPG